MYSSVMSYTTIFTVARMNPPTPGHFYLIRRMFEEAIQHNVKQIYIILSSKTDSLKNPLEPEEKKYLLETYGIPWVKRQLKSKANDITATVLMTHEYNHFKPNDIWASIHFIYSLGGKSLFVAGDTTIPFGKSVDVLLLDRQIIPISGTLVRAIGYLSLPALEAIYMPFGICQKEVYIIYSAIRRLDPPDEANLIQARTVLKERYELRFRKG